MIKKNWKKKVFTMILAMAMVLQYTQVEYLVMAKGNKEYVQQDVDSVEVVDESEDSDEWIDITDTDEAEDSDEWIDVTETDEEEDSDDSLDEVDASEEDSEDADEEEDIEEEDDDEEDAWVEPTLKQSSLTLKVGKSSELTVDGDWEEIEWKSNKTSVAKVDSDGNVTGVKAGTAVITATVYYYSDEDDFEDDEDYEDVDDVDEFEEIEDDDEDVEEELSVKTFKCKVKVTAVPIKLSAKKVTLKVGKSKTLKVTGTTSKVSWKTSNKKIAKVSKGKVTAVKAGKAKITAKVGKKSLVCTVTVKKK